MNEGNKFSVGGHQFLLECCPKLIKPTILNKIQTMKGNLKTKMNNIVQLGCLFSKLPSLFVNFPSAIVGVFHREWQKVQRIMVLGQLEPSSMGHRFESCSVPNEIK
jgi:hypothetical protein